MVAAVLVVTSKIREETNLNSNFKACRREFFTTCAAFLGGLFLGPVTALAKPRPKAEYVHPKFGEYVRHSLWHYFYNGRKHSTFLCVQFKDCWVQWYSFNVSWDLCKRIEKMNPAELFSHESRYDSDELVFLDNIQIVNESEQIIRASKSSFKNLSVRQ